MAARKPAPRAWRGVARRDSPGGVQAEEFSVAPYAGRVLGKGQLGQLVIDGAREFGLEPVADEQSRGGAMLRLDDPQRMFWPEQDAVAAVEPERDTPVAAFAVDPHLDGSERRRIDVDLEL